MDVVGGHAIIRCGLHHVERILQDPGLGACDYTLEVRVEDYDRDESTAIPCMCLVKVLAAFDVTVVCVQYDCTEHDVFCYKGIIAQINGCPLRIMRRGRTSTSCRTFFLFARFQYVCHRMLGSSLRDLFVSFKCGDTLDCTPFAAAPRHVRLHLRPSWDYLQGEDEFAYLLVWPGSGKGTLLVPSGAGNEARYKIRRHKYIVVVTWSMDYNLCCNDGTDGRVASVSDIVGYVAPATITSDDIRMSDRLCWASLFGVVVSEMDAVMLMRGNLIKNGSVGYRLGYQDSSAYVRHFTQYLPVVEFAGHGGVLREADMIIKELMPRNVFHIPPVITRGYLEVALIQLSHEQAEVEGALRLTRGSAASQVQVINSRESSVHLQVQEARQLSVLAASRLRGVIRVGKVGRIPLAAVMAMPIEMRKGMLDDREHLYGLDTSPTVPATACSGCSTSFRRGFRHEILIRVRLRDVARGRIPFEPLRDATQDLKTCAYCFSKHLKMKRCVCCRWARYCNRGCQIAHWPAHRHVCCPDHCLPIGQDFIALSSLSEGVFATVTEAGDQGDEPDPSADVDRRDAAHDLKTCAYCFSQQPKMKKCTGCRWARYCNRRCQTAHWRAHRLMCRPWP